MSHTYLQNINRKRPYHTHTVEEKTEREVTDRGGHKRPRLAHNETPSDLNDGAPAFNASTIPMKGCVSLNDDHDSQAPGRSNTNDPEETQAFSLNSNKPEPCTHEKHVPQGATSLSQVWGRYAMSNAKLRECHFLRINRSRHTPQDHNANPPSTN